MNSSNIPREGRVVQIDDARRKWQSQSQDNLFAIDPPSGSTGLADDTCQCASCAQSTAHVS